MKRYFLAVSTFILLATAASAATLTIKNAKLSVSYDSAAYQFSATDRVSETRVLAEGKLLDSPVASAEALAVNDPVFGKGRQIRGAYADGAVSSLELYPDLPFLLIKTEFRNSQAIEFDLEHVVPVQFAVDLQTSATELRTLGTAGLTAPEKNPGSYLFLTVTAPATRRGVVAGWLTQERGSGVLFSTVEHDRVGIRAQIDYGHLRIPAGASSKLETLAVGVFADARIGEELYGDAVARQYRIHLHPQMNGYCTWYSNPHG